MSKPNPNPPIVNEQIVQRFWRHVDKTPGQGPQGDCWEWIYFWRCEGSTNPVIPRHARFGIKGRETVASHRLAFYLATGKWSPVLICHRCDNPPCCRPDHLFEGTDAENMADMVAKGRHVSRSRPDWNTEAIRRAAKYRRKPFLKGIYSGNAKLADIDVLIIKALYATGGLTQRTIGRYFGVSIGAISDILRDRTWTHVQVEDHPGLAEAVAEKRGAMETTPRATGRRHGATTHPERTVYGSQCKLAKLGESDVVTIRQLWSAGDMSQTQIADLFGVAQTLVSQITRRKIWTRVP